MNAFLVAIVVDGRLSCGHRFLPLAVLVMPCGGVVVVLWLSLLFCLPPLKYCRRSLSEFNVPHHTYMLVMAMHEPCILSSRGCRTPVRMECRCHCVAVPVAEIIPSPADRSGLLN